MARRDALETRCGAEVLFFDTSGELATARFNLARGSGVGRLGAGSSRLSQFGSKPVRCNGPNGRNQEDQKLHQKGLEKMRCATLTLTAVALLADGAAAFSAPAVLRAPSPALASRAGVVTLQETGTSSSSGGGGFSLPFFNRDVPTDQQPTEEMKALRQQSFMDWADDSSYGSKLTGLYQAIMLFLALPISYTTYYVLPDELPNLFLSASLGTFAAMIPFAARLRVGWGFVAGRLKSKEVYFEADQTGQIATKNREAIYRDRLIYDTQVAPILKRIDASIYALALALLLSVGGGQGLVILQGDAAPATLKTLSGDNAIRFNNRLKGDDEFAREEQRRAQSRAMDRDGDGVVDLKPTYCDSRYYKILAGGNSQGGVGCGGSY